MLFAPLYVAVERGYFASAGLVPDLTPIGAGQDAMALLATGQLDLVAAGLSAAFFNAVQRGLDVRYVASTAYQPKTGHPSAILVREDLYASGQLRSLKDLRGRSIAWNGGLGAASTYYVERILRSAGLGIRDLNVTNLAMSDQPAALERKAIDAVFTSAPIMELLETQKLARFLAGAPSGIAGSGLFVGSTVLADHAVGSSILRAARKGAADLVGANYARRPNMEAMSKYTGLPVETIARSPRYDVDAALRPDDATLMDMQAVFSDLGVLSYKNPIAANRLVETY